MVTVDDIASEEWKIEILKIANKDLFQINSITDIEEATPLIFHRDEMENIAAVCHQFITGWWNVQGEFE